MGCGWKDDKSDGAVSEFYDSSNHIGEGDSFGATRTVVKSQCRTEEVEPGKFVRKCEKTEETFKRCLGRPDEMVHSIKEYTEEDVTDQMVKGPFPLESAENGRPSYFPGLRSDIEAIERDVLGGINKFFEAAEEMKNEIFGSIGVPRIFDKDSSSSSSSSHKQREYHIEGPLHDEALPKKNSNGEVDLAGLARDV